jgi:hypothetical protein
MTVIAKRPPAIAAIFCWNNVLTAVICWLREHPEQIELTLKKLVSLSKLLSISALKSAKAKMYTAVKARQVINTRSLKKNMSSAQLGPEPDSDKAVEARTPNVEMSITSNPSEMTV